MSKIDLGVALVTGASSGIGRATAQALKRAGYRVFGTSRRAVAETFDGITMLIRDVTDDTSVRKMVDEVLSEPGRIDLLVNNAGIGLLGGAEESSAAQALYASTKHALEGYSESLDHELRTFGIRVALVEPGFTRTSFEGNLTKPDRSSAIYDSVRAGMEVHLRNGVAAGDAPEVVAETVVKAATAAVPRRRYAAGRLARQVRVMRRFVPESAFDKSLRKHNHLPV